MESWGFVFLDLHYRLEATFRWHIRSSNCPMAKPKHPKTQSFVRQEHFADVYHFAELEQRISALPTNEERGNAFEVFAEAYLATQEGAES